MRDAEPTITVRYTCRMCGIVDAHVPVKVRGEEDVVQWVGVVVKALTSDHFRRHPWCRATKLDEVKIPVPDGAKRVGDPVEH